MEKISYISTELRDWIINTLKRGTNPEAIVDAMIKKGFDPKFSYSTLLKIVGNQSIKTINDHQEKFMLESSVNEIQGTIELDNREVKVLMRLDKPFVVYLDHFLSSDECDELISLSRNRLNPSTIIDPKTGEERLATGRTSEGAYFYLNENSIVTTIEKRIEELTNHPMEHGEGLQVLHYEIGQEYKPHFDYFPPNKIDSAKGGQRVGTVLLYLNDVQAGGETIFPKTGLSITPKKGAALYFLYGNSRGQVDRLSLHSSIPVTEGEKWVATKWIRQGKIER